MTHDALYSAVFGNVTDTRRALQHVSHAEALALAQRSALRDLDRVTHVEIMECADVREELLAPAEALFVERVVHETVHRHRYGALHLCRCDDALFGSHARAGIVEALDFLDKGFVAEFPALPGFSSIPTFS